MSLQYIEGEPFLGRPNFSERQVFIDPREGADRYYGGLKVLAQAYQLPTFDIKTDIQAKLTNIERGKAELGKLQSVPRDIARSSHIRLRTAGAYFSQVVHQLIARGADAYKPTDQDKLDFCDRLINGGVDLVLYYALSKTKSPTRTGSPNTLIDAAEIEMLKYMAVMTRTAAELDMNLRIVMVDETAIMPEDQHMGLTREEKIANQHLVHRVLEDFEAQDTIVVRPLLDSVATPLGNDFPQLYGARHQQLADITREQIAKGEKSQLSIRAFTLLDCMPNEGLRNMGIDDNEIEIIRSQGRQIDLRTLPTHLLDYLTSLTAHINAVMDLRPEAAARVRSNGNIDKYPEYDETARLSGGVTRSKTRWSFLPHPKRNMGRVINPMHGLALYDGTGGEYLGVTPYHELNQLESQDQARVVSIQGKPVFGLTRRG